MSYYLFSMTFKNHKKKEKTIVKKKKKVLETYLKINIVFCLIWTELFLLKYIHMHMNRVLLFFAVRL